MLEEIDRNAAEGRSFAFETARIARWRAAGFMEIYRARVDYWQWLDNSGPVPILLEEGANE